MMKVELVPHTGIRYDERMQGTLQLFRTQKQVEAAAKEDRKSVV